MTGREIIGLIKKKKLEMMQKVMEYANNIHAAIRRKNDTRKKRL